MLKKIRERKIHYLFLAFVIGLFLGFNFSFKALATESTHRYLDYFHNIYQIIVSEYVEMPSKKDLFYGAIDGMIKSLDDPYSRFLDEKSYEELKEMTTGKFVGVGIEITVREDEIVVITPIDDSPAMDAGILSGDVISRVDDKNIKGKKLPEVVKLIKGMPGTTVVLSIKREGMDDLIDFELRRTPIKLKSVTYDIIEENNTGYLKIKSFGSDTTKDTRKALKFFNNKKINKLIIDLRYNPGGLLNAAVNISDLFLEKEKLIVSTKGRMGKRSEQVFKSENDPVYTGSIIVLVNKGSASASEILSAAVKDNKRGTLLGEKTFGKGSVQKSFNLDDNLGVAITIARYYTPSGELIHGKGIKPDYDISLETINKNDRKNMGIIEKKKLMDAFVTKNMEYTEESKARFKEHLKKNNVELSNRSADFLLKARIYRYKKKPLYDLEFDKQLVKALDIISDQTKE